MADTNKAIRRLDYKLPEYLVEHTHLVFNVVDEAKVEVEGTLTMSRNEEAKQAGESEIPAIELNRGDEIKNLVSIDIDGVAIAASEFGTPGSDLKLPGKNGRFTLKVKTILNPAENKSYSGLYKSNAILVTQMESMGFRNVIPFPDRPDVLCSWSTEVKADKKKYPNLIATGDLIVAMENNDGTHTAKFESKFKMPSYLYALVAGEFACLEDKIKIGADETNLQIYVEPNKIGRAQIAMDALKLAMQFDMKESGRKYPLKDFKIVATDYFNFGAMENFGLNIFNSSSALGDPSVTLDGNMISIALVVAHEYLHTWRGDLVTVKSWHEIALKEGFVTLMEDIFHGELIGHESSKISEIRGLRISQFSEDSSSTAHSILQDEYIDDPSNGMYTTTTYDKGGQVIGMIKTMLGEAKFREGTDKYFADFEGKAATLEQLVNSFQSVSGVDFTQFKNWLAQVGTPLCEVTSAYDEVGQKLSLTVKQKCPREPFLVLHFPLAMGLVGPDGKAVKLDLEGELAGHDLSRGILNITKAEETFVFKNVAKGTIPSLLRNFSAPVKLIYNYSTAELLHLMKNDEDGFNRYDAGQRIAKNELNNLLKQYKAGENLTVNAETLAAYESVLVDVMKINSALAADMLILPGEMETVQEMEIYDFDAAKAIIKTLKKAIATKFRANFLEIYNQYKALALAEEAQPKAPALNIKAIKTRKVKNVCLSYLETLKGPEEIALIKNQFESATNMSDEFSALNLLADIPAEREAALKKFYDKWQKEYLVIDMWIRAVSYVDDNVVFEKVRELMASNDLKDPTPSRMSSLYAFGFAKNYTHFHAISGEGYALIVDGALSLKNDQVASRIIKEAFSDLPKMDEKRQNLMKDQLRRLLATPGVLAGPMLMAKKILGE